MVDPKVVEAFVTFNPNPLLLIGEDGTVVFANPASSPVLANMQCEVGQKVGATWLEKIKVLCESGVAEQVEIFEFGLTIELLLVPAYGPPHMVNVFGRDVTRERELEVDKAQAQHKAALLAMVTTYNHEINNPLMIAMGFLSKKYEQLNEESLGKVRKALERVQDILKKTRELEEGRVEFENYGADAQMISLKKKVG